MNKLVELKTMERYLVDESDHDIEEAQARRRRYRRI